MLDTIKRFFKKAPSETPQNGKAHSGHDVRVATCALFLEMGRIDETFTDDELAKVVSILREKYGLSQDDADALMTAADDELEKSVDYWQFAKSINTHYFPEEKVEIIEILWQIVYVDGKLDSHEDYLMHKLGKLLRLSHQQLMDAKMKVLYPG